MTNTAKIITALVAGAAAGAVLGILFAPDKGSETRKKVGDESKKLAQSLKEKFNLARKKYEEGKSNLQQSMDEMDARTDRMREKMNEYANT